MKLINHILDSEWLGVIIFVAIIAQQIIRDVIQNYKLRKEEPQPCQPIAHWEPPSIRDKARVLRTNQQNSTTVPTVGPSVH